MKLHNILLTCALGAGSLLGAAAPASAARVVVGTARPAATGRVLSGNRYYGTGYRSYGYRNGYGYPYRYGYGYAIPTATALALALATLAEATAMSAEATDTRPIRPYMGAAHIGHTVLIGGRIAAHIGDGASFANVSLTSFLNRAATCKHLQRPGQLAYWVELSSRQCDTTVEWESRGGEVG